MTDYFDLLGEPRRPWLDAEALKARFLELSGRFHPDRFHNSPEQEKTQAASRYMDLNRAWQCLSDPKDRLQHLVELEAGATPRNIQKIPPGTMDLFMEVGQVCRDCDAFLARRAGVTSPILRVQLVGQALEWTERLNGLKARVNRSREDLLAELQAMNTAWETAPPVGAAGRAKALPLERLEQVYRSLSYVTRWSEQIQERLVQLAH